MIKIIYRFDTTHTITHWFREGVPIGEVKFELIEWRNFLIEIRYAKDFTFEPVRQIFPVQIKEEDKNRDDNNRSDNIPMRSMQEDV